MSFFDWLFGDDDPDPVTYTSTSNTSIPGYISEASERAVGEAERLAGIPYAAYESPRIAGFTDDQLAGMQGIRDIQGVGTGKTNLAYAMGIGSGAPVSQTDIDRFLNPYLEQVAGVTERRLDERAAQQAVADKAQAAMEGAWGGSRAGVVDVLRSRDLERNVADVYTNTLASGYESALNNIFRERTNTQNAANLGGALAAQGQNLGYQDINSMLGIGALQQEQEQASLNLGYQDYLRQQQYPWEQLNRLTGVIQGVPYEQSSTTTSQQPGTPSSGFFQQAAGLGIAALGTAGNLGWNPLA